ncbi:Uu.00g045090.m01.CDS01 [Anthostomella pinea]|uniref:Uu.00g045090.m01.CDS01 n=1 Tax=Anthostomella pinea TaxID=933095 RepID=A0AAI8VC39_9PEZI|nr:Uu.00g045090.m01.CDS01 [Anthostomella pinea]
MFKSMKSHGRGGAGNIAGSSKSPKLEPEDLETPHLKSSVVTTGRGGVGNMAPNDDPVATRARQDVGPIVRNPSTGPTHVGRGGAANVVDNPEELAEEAAPANTDGADNKKKKLSAKTKEFFKKT